MTFSQWLFGDIDNPFKAGQWGALHILVMLLCAALILLFHFASKCAKNPEKTRRIIISTLMSISVLFEIMLRFTRGMNHFYFWQMEVNVTSVLELALPKPWCQISTWLLISAVFVKKPFFYNFASLSALLSAIVFFSYPGVGFNNEYLLFENWYSICTHALLLTTSITMICFKYADFRYRWFGKLMLCFGLTFVYGLLQIFVLKIHVDPMYFMPNGDIQAGILKMDYGLYLFLYFAVLLIYINVPHLLGDRETVRRFMQGIKGKLLMLAHKNGGETYEEAASVEQGKTTEDLHCS